MKTILLAYRGIIFREIQKQNVPFLQVQELNPETNDPIGLPKEISFVNCTDAMVFEYSKEPNFDGLYLKPVAHSGSYECTFFGTYVYESVIDQNDYSLDNRIIILMDHCFDFPEEDSKIEWLMDYSYGISRKISKQFRKASKRYLTKSCLAYYKDLHDLEKTVIENYDVLSTYKKYTLNAGNAQEFFETYKMHTDHWIEFADKCINDRSELMIPVTQFRVLRDKLSRQIDQFNELIRSFGKSEE